MKTSLNKTQLTAGGLTLAVIMSLFGLGYYYNKSGKYNQQVGQEKLKNESLLSEKIHLEKEVMGLQFQINGLKGKNSELDKTIEEINKAIAQKENTIKSLKGNQANAAKLKKEIASLQKMKADLSSKLHDLNKTVEELKNKNSNLENAIALLEKDKASLELALKGMQCVATNNFLVESTKKNNKSQTIRAKRTKNVKLGFDVNHVGAEDVTFKITSPDGKLLDSKTIKVAENTKAVEYANNSSAKSSAQKRIEYTYKPKSKMTKGTYKIEVYKKDTYLGENQFKLE